MAPPEQPPLWLWIIMGGLFVFCMILLASSQTDMTWPKRKAKLD